MANVERFQHISFRLLDVACSALAFASAYITLAPIQAVLTHLFPVILQAINRVVLASATGSLPSWPDLVWIGVVVTLSMSVTLEYGNDSTPIGMRRKIHIVGLLLGAICVSAAVLSTVFYALHEPLYSRLFVFSYLSYLFLLTVTYRLVWRNFILRREQGSQPQVTMVLAGTPEGVQLYLHHTLGELPLNTNIAGCLLTEDKHSETGLTPPVLGHVSALGDLLVHQPIDEVVIVLPGGTTPWLANMIEHCDYFRVSVQIVYEAVLGIELRDLKTLHTRQRIPAVTLIPEEDSLSDRLAWKRLVDVVLSASALVVLLPVLAAIAIGIKLTTPELPIFYTWSAVGYRGHHFKGYKFTTMVADAEQKKEALKHLNEMEGPVFKIKNDPRMTPIGKFLRKYSLNELPQFWSVLVGDMSLVGPRPALPKELSGYQLWHKRKLSVRPGITCFWQVRGRNVITSFDDWVKMDLEYIQKRSMRTDMSILLQTVKVVLRGSGS